MTSLLLIKFRVFAVILYLHFDITNCNTDGFILFETLLSHMHNIQILTHQLSKSWPKAEHYCSAWSRSQVRNKSFGPKQNTTHYPPTKNFSKGSRFCRGTFENFISKCPDISENKAHILSRTVLLNISY